MTTPPPPPSSSSSQIPDLRTLIRPRGNQRGRGGGLRGRVPGPPPDPSNYNTDGPARLPADGPLMTDENVQHTDDDAAAMRLSAVQKGYLEDSFASYFARRPPEVRFPIMNRGTYLRTTAIDTLVTRFITTDPTSPKQIISLGAGTDTRFFRLATRFPETKLIYHELDFPVNTQRKVAAIEGSDELLRIASSATAAVHGHDTPEGNSVVISPDKTTLISAALNVHPIDLRAIATTTSSSPPPSLPNLSPTIPTLLLSECCLCYLPASTSASILANFATRYIPVPTPLAAVIYEPTHPHTPFGRRMAANLRQSRNLHLPGVDGVASPSAQRARLRAAGLDTAARAADGKWLYASERWVPAAERSRVERLEWVDEVEEWELLVGHYCVAWGWREGVGVGAEREGEGVFSRAWRDLPGQEEG